MVGFLNNLFFIAVGGFIWYTAAISEVEGMFGMSYDTLKTEVEVCKALADKDSECHISMKVIEKYPVNIDTVGNRRDRFCKNFDMEGKLPNKRIHREAIQ